MNVFKPNNGLNFNDYFILHNEIGPSGAYIHPVVPDSLLMFAYKSQSCFFQLQSKTPLVDDLLKAIAQGVMDFHCTPINLICYFIQSHPTHSLNPSRK